MGYPGKLDVEKSLAVGVHPDWLTQRSSVEEAEAEHAPVCERERAKRVARGESPPAGPFMFGQWRWEEFKAALQPTDEIWHFRSSRASWVSLCGREGYCIVRDGAVASCFYTAMS